MKVLKDLPFIIVYLDNIIIYSKNAEDHLEHLKQVFHKFWNAKLSIKLSKCHFFGKDIQHLGHIISITGIKPLPLKKEAFKLCIHWRTPKKYELSLALQATIRNSSKLFLKLQDHLQHLCIMMQNLTGHQTTKQHLSPWKEPLYRYPYYTTHTLWNDT